MGVLLFAAFVALIPIMEGDSLMQKTSTVSSGLRDVDEVVKLFGGGARAAGTKADKERYGGGTGEGEEHPGPPWAIARPGADHGRLPVQFAARLDRGLKG